MSRGRTDAGGGDSQNPDEYMPLPVSRLPVGVRLRRPVYDARYGQQQLLLAAGQPLLPNNLESLRRRGIDTVLVHRFDFETFEHQRSTTEARRQPRQGTSSQPGSRSSGNASSGAASWQGWKVNADSFIHRLNDVEEAPRDPERIKVFQENYASRVKIATSLIRQLATERTLNVTSTLHVCSRQLPEIVEDCDEFLIRGTAPILTDYPSRHGLQTAMLAIGMAVVMGHAEDDLVELGAGCLLHDVGMLLVPQHLLANPGRLTSSERLELQKHPIHSANLLQECRDFPQQSRHVVYQMHERMNGTGYPRGRVGSQIHPLARISAVADAYLSLISPRPFRKPLLPYAAVERLLLVTRQGQYDPAAIRALLYTVSLFPVGSHVQLSDGRIAQVIRSRREEFGSPIVQIIDPLNPQTEETIDLSQTRRLSIKAPVSAPDFGSPAPATPRPELLSAAASL